MTDAWSQAYLAEDAAEFTCRAASVWLRGPDRRRALDLAAEHAAQRTRIRAARSDLPATPPAYRSPGEATTPAQARAIIADLENSLVPVYADAAAASSGAQRGWATDRAILSAEVAISWGASPQAFPQGP